MFVGRVRMTLPKLNSPKHAILVGRYELLPRSRVAPEAVFCGCKPNSIRCVKNGRTCLKLELSRWLDSSS